MSQPRRNLGQREGKELELKGRLKGGLKGGLNSASTWEQEGHWVECRENRWKVGVLEGMEEMKGLGGPDKEIGFYQSYTSF